MTASGEPPPGTRPCALAEALVDLAARVTGPVSDPHGVDALTELAGAPRDGLCRRVAVVGAVDADDVAATLRWAAAHGVAVAVPWTGFVGDPLVPTVVVTTSRIDRITPDPHARTVTAGVGASWAGVAATARRHDLPPPWTGAGSLADTVRTLGPCGVPGVRAVTVVGGDGVVRRIGPAGEPELWATLRTRPGAADVLGLITGLELGPE